MRPFASKVVCLAALVGCGSSAKDSRAPDGVVVTTAKAPSPPPPPPKASAETASSGALLAAPAPETPAAKDEAALPPGATPPTEASLAADVRAANGFALGLYGKLARKPGNLCVSGTSLRHALGATYLGARGATASELAKGLGFGAPAATSGLGAVELAEWKKAKPESGELSVATRVWVDDAIAIAPAFAELATSYGAPAEALKIAREPEKARAQVNGWVSERTAGKIPELLGQGALDARTRMVVTNAVYLKARWTEPFPKDATKDEPFLVDGKARTSVPMMHLVGSLRYAAVDASKIVELRYDGTPLAMTLVVPDDAAGLAKLEQALGADALERWTKPLAPRKVALALPRFTFTSGGAMNEPLRELGVKTAFSDVADFAGMLAESEAKRPHLAMSQVVQRTFLAVDEIGTEAAAATGVVMRTTSLDISPPVNVTVDRPFLFVLRDVTRGRVLFVGRVRDPR